MRAPSPVLVAGMLALSGCSIFHSNVKGGFACAAPRGTCAPSTTIDDAALRAIDGTTKAQDKGGAANKVRTSERPDRQWVYVGPRPALRIVYPAWRDGDGRIHPRTAAYVPVDAPHVAPLDVIPLEAASLGAGRDTSLLAVAELAPDQSLVASPTPAPQGAGESADNTPVPAPRLIGLAPTGNPHLPTVPSSGAGPLDAIRKQVAGILTAAPKPATTTPTSTGSKPAPTTPARLPKSGASFPPAGN